jgi:hypothetical protein
VSESVEFAVRVEIMSEFRTIRYGSNEETNETYHVATRAPILLPSPNLLDPNSVQSLSILCLNVYEYDMYEPLFDSNLFIGLACWQLTFQFLRERIFCVRRVGTAAG